jgi:hypothetical protein
MQARTWCPPQCSSHARLLAQTHSVDEVKNVLSRIVPSVISDPSDIGVNPE